MPHIGAEKAASFAVKAAGAHRFKRDCAAHGMGHHDALLRRAIRDSSRQAAHERVDIGLETGDVAADGVFQRPVGEALPRPVEADRCAKPRA